MDLLLNSSVKNIWYAFYELRVKKTGQVRCGALLKVEFRDGKTGHADLHPWPEKGEAPLKVQLDKLRKKECTTLCSRVLAIAREEAKARTQEFNLLSSLKIPLSHYLISDVENFCDLDKVLNQGFRIFKVKLNTPLKRQTQKLLRWMQTLGSSVKWRLDFYIKLNEQQWRRWSEEYLVKMDTQYLDFMEVPFQYQERLWMQYEEYPLALDVWNGKNTLPVSTLVWKNSRKSEPELLRKKRAGLFQRVIFTHSLSHPLDQLSSAYFAARFYKIHPHLREVCGLVQKDVYENHKFTLPDRGPCFPRLSGKGWGLDSFLLDRLSWKKCCSYTKPIEKKEAIGRDCKVTKKIIPAGYKR
ncbi:MAG: hypothetical protein OXM55_05995 [Bdellovibrionales bacterium]|nr:hypothetical protein [Bdellovibrionales bacterium]